MEREVYSMYIVYVLYRIWPGADPLWGATSIHGVTILNTAGPDPVEKRSRKQEPPPYSSFYCAVLLPR